MKLLVLFAMCLVAASATYSRGYPYPYGTYPYYSNYPYYYRSPYVYPYGNPYVNPYYPGYPYPGYPVRTSNVETAPAGSIDDSKNEVPVSVQPLNYEDQSGLVETSPAVASTASEPTLGITDGNVKPSDVSAPVVASTATNTQNV